MKTTAPCARWRSKCHGDHHNHAPRQRSSRREDGHRSRAPCGQARRGDRGRGSRCGLAHASRARGDARRRAPLRAAEKFESLWQEMASWGNVVFIVHTPDIVLECEGSLPIGSFGAGYYNIHGDSPIGGHIRARIAGRSTSSTACSMAGDPVRCSSSIRRGRRCSRSSCGVTRRATCWRINSLVSRR